jgi:hypothetical protein
LRIIMNDFARFISACRDHKVTTILIESEPFESKTGYLRKAYCTTLDQPSISRVERHCRQREAECNTYIRLNGSSSPWSPTLDAHIWGVSLHVHGDEEKYRILVHAPLRPSIAIGIGDRLTLLWFAGSEPNMANYFLVQTMLVSYFGAFSPLIDAYLRFTAPGFQLEEEFGALSRTHTPELIVCESERAYAVETMVSEFGAEICNRQLGSGRNVTSALTEAACGFIFAETLTETQREAGLRNFVHSWRAALSSPSLLYSVMDHYNRSYCKPALSGSELAGIVGDFLGISPVDVAREVASGNIPVHTYPHMERASFFEDLGHG